MAKAARAGSRAAFESSAPAQSSRRRATSSSSAPLRPPRPPRTPQLRTAPAPRPDRPWPPRQSAVAARPRRRFPGCRAAPGAGPRQMRRHGSAPCPLHRGSARVPRPREAVAARRSRHRSRPALRRRRRFLVACRECRSRIITAGRSACQMDRFRRRRHDGGRSTDSAIPRSPRGTHPRGAPCRTCSFPSIFATASPLARRFSRSARAAASRTWPARPSMRS